MAAVRTFAALLAGFSIQCWAAPFAVQLGDVRLGLDAPPGFADTAPTGSPRLLELGESLTSASNRILLFAISDADLRRFGVGDAPDLRRYMVVVTPRGMERDRVTPDTFRPLVTELLREVGQPAAAQDYLQHLDAQPVGAVSLLAELRQDSEVVSLLQGSRSKGPGFFERSKHHLSTTSLMLVRGKVLSLSVFTRYEQPADLEWIRLTTARWIEELKRLNAR
jgi:hypothetical protein